MEVDILIVDLGRKIVLNYGEKLSEEFFSTIRS